MGSSIIKSNTFARADTYQDDTDEGDLKHDRRDQLLASNAFDNMVNKQRTVPKKAFSRLTSGKKTSKSATGLNKSVRQRVSKAEQNGATGYVAMSAQVAEPCVPPRRGASPLRLSPDINRAIARELYVDQVVNVVNTGSPSVKPGQMNLFNPKGQKGLAVDFSSKSLIGEAYSNNHDRSVDKIRTIFNDEGGKGKIRNQDLQKKTEAIQNEFETLMADMV